MSVAGSGVRTYRGWHCAMPNSALTLRYKYVSGDKFLDVPLTTTFRFIHIDFGC